MTMENYLSQMGMAHKQLTDRYAEYAGQSQDQPLYYPYEPSPPQVHVNGPFKHQFVSGGHGHKNNAAMSALTLLAFLFFLHILQQCLKDHMTALSTPQVMLMTGGRDGDENIAKLSQNKFDKTGEIETEQENKKNFINHFDAADTSSNSKEKHLMKITSSERESWIKQDTREKYQTKNTHNIFNRFGNHHSTLDYISAAENENPDTRIR